MPLQIVDVPNRGREPLVVSDELVQEFLNALPEVPQGKGIRSEDTFDTESSATHFGRKLIEAITRADTGYVNSKGQAKLGLTVRQVDGRWTVALRNWDR